VSNNYIKFLTKDYPLVSITLKRPKVMCFGYQSTLKNLNMNAKISCPPFDIHKSKLAVIEWHSIKSSKIYNCSVFFTKLGRNLWKNCFLERKTNLGHKCILNHFNQILSTNYKERWVLIIKSPRSSKNYFCYKSSFLKGSFIAKHLDMELVDIFGLFRRLSFIFSQRIVHFFSLQK
jgi:hypothetical protein